MIGLALQRRREALLRLAGQRGQKLLRRLGSGIYRREGAPSAARETELKRVAA